MGTAVDVTVSFTLYSVCTPSSSAKPGQPVGQVKQASFLVPSHKKWSNVRGT